jgi:hypothetical protein
MTASRFLEGSDGIEATAKRLECDPLGAHERMHKGIIAATMMTTLSLVGIAGWFTLSSYLTETSSVALYKASTGQVVTCRATIAPGYFARVAVAVCADACEGHGFAPDGGTTDIDWPSRATQLEARRRWARFIPAPCLEN